MRHMNLEHYNRRALWNTHTLKDFLYTVRSILHAMYTNVIEHLGNAIILEEITFIQFFLHQFDQWNPILRKDFQGPVFVN